VTEPLAEDLLAGTYGPGDTIVVDRGASGSVTFQKKRTSEKPAARPRAQA
jgi:hypothetical protein